MGFQTTSVFSNANSGFIGEVWMNLDGDMSPIILNILPMLTSSSDKRYHRIRTSHPLSMII